MKFSEFNYEQPNMDALQKSFDILIAQFKAAQSVEEQNVAIAEINKLREHFETMSNIAYIRYSIDTANKAYEAEQSFFDKNSPIYSGMEWKYYDALVNSKFRTELEKHWGKHLFNIAEVRLLTFQPEIIADLQKENELSSQYTKLTASAKIMFEGKEYNMSSLAPLSSSKNRETRKGASKAKWNFFSENSAEFDRIYDELVQIRHKMAVKLGFENYVALGYKRMLRTDYDAKMVANYRQQVLDVVVPVAKKLKERQAKRINISDFKYYDSSLTFKTGNPTPKGEPNWIVDNGKKMYEELSGETNEFVNFMLDNELMDLVTRKNKAPGGYCTYIGDYKAPFIFSNFNGTSHDINVLTHEAGHAFQVYMSRNFEIPEYHWPTYEACEIHSMSMEFFAWPWMESFFKEDTTKFKFEHLNDALLFLPYGVSVDEFQHFVYENPTATPQERKAAWKAIEQKYLPWIDYDGNEFLEEGGFWQKQGHIFGSPFYYIDYTLAQICAFQFWKKSREDQSAAFTDYVKLCKAGGSRPFLELVEYANLRSPFDDGCLAEVVQPIEAYLETVDDMAL
ncbi:MAG: M3 family oligoendopeptidase [Chitinophagales bacterium]